MDPTAMDDSKDHNKQDQPKPQATFLTKLYALLERPENHHMIRWDPAGEHIIVERPEQLALHVLPSIYRQSRFASFSRQLNIYGFMRKVNLRNVDPAIDDPDASTWSHPTLNRHSPPEVVANFKRRVPPRLPKPRKRDPPHDPISIPPPRSAGMGGMGPMLSMPGPPGPGGIPNPKLHTLGRARGFSDSFTPLSQGGGGWGNSGGSYGRSALPPLTVPTSPPGMYPQPPSTDSPTSASFGGSSYHSSAGGNAYPPYGNPYPSSGHEPQSWGMNPPSSAGSGGSLSSLLNPSQHQPSSGASNGTHYGQSNSRPHPTINTNTHSSSSYSSPFSNMPMHSHHHPSGARHSPPISPDSHSRPNTGYSISSVSSLPYAEDHYNDGYGSRPGSSSHRPPSPSPVSRPTSSSAASLGYASASASNTSLSVRNRQRRHSQAVSPYPSPYDHHMDQPRPSTSPQPPIHEESYHHHRSGGGAGGGGAGHHSHHSPTSSHHPPPHSSSGGGGLPRVRSMIQLPSVDPYSFNPHHADFAYSATGPAVGLGGGLGNNNRPSTSTSSISAASVGSSSQANTPPVTDNLDPAAAAAGGFKDVGEIGRFSPDFGFMPMNEPMQGYAKGEM